MFEQDYRVCFPKERIYISRNHQWAFAAWAMGKSTGLLGEKTTLLHVDAHLDDTWDGVVVEGLHGMKGNSDYLDVAGKLEIDNFIWAGFAAQTIDYIVYVCPKHVDESDPFDLTGWNLEGEQLKPIREILKQREYKGSRYECVQHLREHLSASSDRINQVLNYPNSVILDLDLDVFKLNLSDPLNLELKPDDQIRDELSFLRDLYPYDMITVALSPAFCGGENNCERLYRLFLEGFELELSKAETW
ncbi:UPF0489 family protein [Cohnella luojiensis]|uniref:Arginase n=1 Tax=Cohnella luojiensis TaxID=652876 RepID=A0A4Y8LPZ5_9BACL|nr:UPF0489 family protein [Cohnella luojiensis]TFE22593.1 hypothetical protein E2980_21645 [Cohnella luojiensis]